MKKVKQIFAMFAVMLLVASPAFAGSGNTTIKQSAGTAATLATMIGLGVKKTDGTDFSAEETEMLKAVQTIVNDGTSGKITKEDVAAEIEKLKDVYSTPEQIKNVENIITELKEAMLEQGNVLRGMQPNVTGTKGSMLGAITKQITEKGAEFMQKLQTLTSGTKNSERFEIKAPISSLVGGATTATFIGGTVYESNIEVIPTVDDDLFQYVNMRPDNGSGVRVSYMEQTNVRGNAAVVGCGELKPLRTFDIEEKFAKPIKVAVQTPICDEYLMFAPSLVNLIETDLTQEIKRARNEALILSIATVANAYNLTTINTTNPTNYDAIRAAIAQVRSLNYKPSVVFLNPIDAANFEIEKGTDGHYMHICACSPTDGAITISTLRVIETNAIPVGDFLVGDMSRVNVRFLTSIILTMGKGIMLDDAGVIVDQLTHNITTIICEQFLNMYIPAQDGNAFVYDKFANVIAAI